MNPVFSHEATKHPKESNQGKNLRAFVASCESHRIRESGSAGFPTLQDLTGFQPETWLPFGTRPHQASRRDATFISSLEPWVETHGYHQVSLRDRGTPGYICGAQSKTPRLPSGVAPRPGNTHPRSTPSEESHSPDLCINLKRKMEMVAATFFTTDFTD